MSSPIASNTDRLLVRLGSVGVGLAVFLALVVAALVLGPARLLTERGTNGTTLVVDVSAERNWAVYSTLRGWREASCDVFDADGTEIVLRPDMVQQRLRGWPTWYPQGSFRLDRSQRLTVTCEGPPGQFAVGPSVGLGQLLSALGLGLVSVVLAIGGLILLIVTAARQRGRRRA